VDRNQRQLSVLAFLEALTDGDLSLSTLAPATPPEPTPEEADSSDRERRIKERYSTQRNSSCKPLQRAAEKPWVSEVVNLSETGLCLEAGRRFERGALLTVVLEGETTTRRSLVVRVRWVKKLSPKTWQMGCEFDRPLCDFEVHELR
jgi:hypothetical protein